MNFIEQVRSSKLVVCILVVLFIAIKVTGITIAVIHNQKDDSLVSSSSLSLDKVNTEQTHKNNTDTDKHIYEFNSSFVNTSENIGSYNIDSHIKVESKSDISTKSEDKLIESSESTYENSSLVSSELDEPNYNLDNKGKYPVAENIWNILKSYGWSDVVCAGIMGNLMAEVGGHTLNLDWHKYSGNTIGVCQWLGSRKSNLILRYGSNPSCEEQIQYMYDELTGSNGVSREVTSSQYNKIINSSTPEEAALMFAKYFERCSTSSYSARERNAATAYKYFCK